MAEPTDERPQGEESASEGPVIIKKYANRRLYNTATSAYVTLDHLSEMVKQNVDFEVRDARSGEDITRSVLAQIIFDQEGRGQNLLPVSFLRRLIHFYGDNMQGFLPAYLDMSMESFSKSQEQMREQFTRAFGTKTPLGAFEESARQNVAMFQQAMKIWSPFAAANFAKVMQNAEKPPEPQAAAANAEETITELKKQMELMQKQLDLLSTGRKP